MEDPRIISALFIFLKMAYYNVLINTERTEGKREEKHNKTTGTTHAVIERG